MDEASAEVAARDIIRKRERAWNHGDDRAFAEDTDSVGARGDRQRGRNAMAVGHEGIFHNTSVAERA